MIYIYTTQKTPNLSISFPWKYYGHFREKTIEFEVSVKKSMSQNESLKTPPNRYQWYLCTYQKNIPFHPHYNNFLCFHIYSDKRFIICWYRLIIAIYTQYYNISLFIQNCSNIFPLIIKITWSLIKSGGCYYYYLISFKRGHQYFVWKHFSYQDIVQ